MLSLPDLPTPVIFSTIVRSFMHPKAGCSPAAVFQAYHVKVGGGLYLLVQITWASIPLWMPPVVRNVRSGIAEIASPIWSKPLPNSRYQPGHFTAPRPGLSFQFPVVMFCNPHYGFSLIPDAGTESQHG
jgi:hypothetical protein